MDRTRRSAGFTLVEVLVALVVAGLLLPALARAFSGAWAASRIPMETMSAMTLARDAASDIDPAQAPGFRVARSIEPVEVRVLPSDVAAAPARSGKQQGDGLTPEATPSAMKLALPQIGASGPGGPATGPAPALALRRISVVVTAPSGRRVVFDSVTLDTR